jgi:hypothetical protein
LYGLRRLRTGLSEQRDHGRQSDLRHRSLKCTECVGAEDEPQCKLVCQESCIEPNPDWNETPEELLAKYQQLHE